MFEQTGYHQAEREPTRNAQRIGEFTERGLSGEDIWLYVNRPHNS